MKKAILSITLLLTCILTALSAFAQSPQGALPFDHERMFTATRGKLEVHCMQNAGSQRFEPGRILSDGDGNILFLPQELEVADLKAKLRSASASSRAKLSKKLNRLTAAFKRNKKICAAGPDKAPGNIKLAASGCGQAPIIIEQPAPLQQTVASGVSVTYSAAGAFCNPTQQWQKNYVDVPGATGPSYTFSASASDNGSYWRAKFCNSVGCRFTLSAHLYVSSQSLVITDHPDGISVPAGSTASFSVAASGVPPIAYQWQRQSGANWADISGAMSSSYSFTAQAQDNGAYFRAKVSNAQTTIYSNSAYLQVLTGNPPTITAHPQDKTVNAGSYASFSVQATGSYPLSYQWLKNGSTISGATSSSYGLTAQPGDNGAAFSVRVTNPFGTVTSNSAILTVTGTPPTISVHPISQTVVVGQSVTFSVQASGSGPLNYVWRKDGINISGTNSPTYTRTATLSDNGAAFTVKVWNSYGNVISNPAILTVTNGTPPTITQHPQSQSVLAGQSVTFTVQASGTAPLSYQWRKNGTNINGATSSSYTKTASLSDNGAAFSCKVSNAAGNAVSNNAILTVTNGTPPTIVQHPQSQTAMVGQTVVFSVVATGIEPFTYQWRKNGSNISGATSQTYARVVQQSDNGANFSVRVSNQYGNTTSNNALLTVVSQTIPIIIEHPDSSYINLPGEPVTMSVQALGSGLTYQWMKEFESIPGANSSTYTTTAEYTGKHYHCVVSNSFGSVPSRVSWVFALNETYPPGNPNIIPWIVRVPAGTPTTLEASVYHFGSISYQWFKNGSPIPGATSRIYSFNAQSSDDGAGFHFEATNPYGSAESEIRVVTISATGEPPGVPSWSETPQDKTAASNTIVQFVANDIYGTGPMAMRWQKNGSDIFDMPGADSHELYTNPLTMADNGAKFRLKITNPYGTTYTREATLTVMEAPVITQQPSDQTVFTNMPATFEVVATGPEPLTYQWYRAYGDSSYFFQISGATNSIYICGSLDEDDTGDRFKVRVCAYQGACLFSNIATVTVIDGTPVIVQQPTDQTMLIGPGANEGSATFSVIATGEGLQYNWFSNVPGQPPGTEPQYTVTCTRQQSAYCNGRQYRVRVRAINNQYVYSNWATLSIVTSPTISSHPQSKTVDPGEQVTFSVSASAIIGGLTIQWQKNDADIPGATSSSYTLTAQVGDNQAQFRARVFNAAGEVLSNVATLTVRQPLPVLIAPQSTSVFDKNAATFHCLVDGDDLRYEWYKNGQKINDPRLSTYFFVAHLEDSGAQYRCRAYNSNGYAFPPAATLTVNPRPANMPLPQLSGFVPGLGGYSTRLAVSPAHPGLAFVAADTFGLVVVSYADPSNPMVMATLPASDVPASGSGIAVEGNIAVLNGSPPSIIDISDPFEPLMITQINAPGGTEVALHDGIAYLIDYEGKLRIIDTGNPTVILSTTQLVGGFDIESIRFAEISGHKYLFTPIRYDSVYITNVDNPAAPQPAGALASSSSYKTFGLAIYQSGAEAYAYVTFVGSGYYMEIFRITDPQNEVYLGRISFAEQQNRPYVMGNLLLVPPVYGGTNTLVYSLASPAAPTLLGGADRISCHDHDDNLAISGSFVVGVLDDLKVYEVSASPSVMLRGQISYDSGYSDAAAIENNLVAVGGYNRDMKLYEAAADNSLTLRGSIGFRPKDLVIQNSKAYAVNETGLAIMDLSSGAPTVLGSVALDGRALKVKQIGSQRFAFIAGSLGLQIADVTNAASPVLFSTAFPVGADPAKPQAKAISLFQNGSQLFAYVTAGVGRRMKVFNVTSPAGAFEAASMDIAGPEDEILKDVCVVGNKLALSHNSERIQIYTLGNPLQPSLQGSLYTNHGRFGTDGTRLFISAVGNYYYERYYGLGIADISIANNPRLLNLVDTPSGNGAAVSIGTGRTIVGDSNAQLAIIAPNP